MAQYNIIKPNFSRNLKLEIIGGRTIFKTNFSGDPGRDRFMNLKHPRSVSVVIDDEAIVDELKRLGFNVKTWINKETDEPTNYAKIIINFEDEDNRRSIIRRVSENGRKIRLDDETVGGLDNEIINHVDAYVSLWERGDGTARNFYLDFMDVYVDEDRLPSWAREDEEYDERGSEDDREPF